MCKTVLKPALLIAVALKALILLMAIYAPVSLSGAASDNSYKILQTQAQDASIFTQGLYIEDNTFYISSGRYGRSFIKKLPANNAVIKHKLPGNVFAEGLTVLNDRIYMLTWKAGTLIEFDKNTLEPKKTYQYEGEGWGLTHDGEYFLMSNGSHYIEYRSTNAFERIKYLRVTHNGKPLKKINELEFANDFIWANVWFDDHIYQISPDTGKVVNTWDLSALRAQVNTKNNDAVLNGIAYDAQKKAFWVTGKLWPKRFLITLNYSTDAMPSATTKIDQTTDN